MYKNKVFSAYLVVLNWFQPAQMFRVICKRYDCNWPQKMILPHRYPHALLRLGKGKRKLKKSSNQKDKIIKRKYERENREMCRI